MKTEVAGRLKKEVRLDEKEIAENNPTASTDRKQLYSYTKRLRNMLLFLLTVWQWTVCFFL